MKAIRFLLFSVVLFSCSAPPDPAIRLRWVKAYPGEKWEDVRTGLLWSLSYLGASLDSSNAKQLIERTDSSQFVLHLDRAGFSSSALQQLLTICENLRGSEEYEKNNAIDLGRFLVLTEHTSNHYYSITGAAPTLQEFYRRHPFTNEKSYHLYRSAVAEHQRNLRFSIGKEVSAIAWIAEEGEGSIDSGTFRVEAYEALDVMPNGQLRFAIYDAAGNLVPGSPTHLGKAGKPSKCIWCHELSVAPLFFETPEPLSGISTTEFGKWVDSSQHLIDRHRATLHPLIRFANVQDHTFGELLYISFMEPSAFRLANEWNTDTTTVAKKMPIATHTYAEFPFLGNCYYRYYADSLSPYEVRKVPVSVREYFGSEPDYLTREK